MTMRVLEATPTRVIAGLDPAIQDACEIRWIHQVFLDRRVKPGDDILGMGRSFNASPRRA
jgi:hypothetical protein